MNLYMNIVLRTFIAISSIALFPGIASAHAIPVDMSPASSAVVDEAPAEIRITFSERIDPAASTVSVSSPTMATREKVRVEDDPRTLIVPLVNDGHGTYFVSWSVVSSDDGHFTKGAYAFAVGPGQIVATSTESSEVIAIATKPEALSMTVELFGNGLIWAALVLFAFAIRPLLRTGAFINEEATLHRGYTLFIIGGTLLALVGGALQLWVKSSDLSILQGLSVLATVPIYLQTAAGFATAVRMCVVAFVLATFLLGRKSIAHSARLSMYEWAMFAAMCVFAFYRAKISHATANPFFPDLSIAVNVLHLIEKDIWAGILLALVILSCVRSLRAFLLALVPRAFQLLAIDFALVSVTASYIVWLHLKDFGNLFTTKWGAAFLQLLACAIILVALRGYHVFARTWRSAQFTRLLPFSLGAEFAAALIVVYCSSVVIITSPPLSTPPTTHLSARDQGAEITLMRDRYEDGMILLTVPAAAQTPVVTLQDKSGSTGPISIDLVKRFEGGYVFPETLLAGKGPFKATIDAPQAGRYDAHAVFEFPKGAFEAPEGWESHRKFDLFTLVMILFALGALGAAGALYYLSDRPVRAGTGSLSQFSAFQAVGSFLIVSFIAGAGIQIIGVSANPFKALCEADGNMWHLMQPMRSGVPLSSISTEGCMWGIGRYMYMFADKREYDHYRALPHADVTLSQDKFIAGVPSTFVISLKETDGSPATLFTDMEKLVHVVIVSKDQTVFSHIHADDTRTLTRKEIDSSTFEMHYTFPKSGDYLLSVDYAHGLTLESKQFPVTVSGAPAQADSPKTYQQSGNFQGYEVSLDSGQPYAREVTTIRYEISKDGKPVTDAVPYLSAAMHVSVVKNDFSEFIHVHGEVHPPGTPLPPVIVKDGKIIHSMAMMNIPPKFGPNIEAHVIFPTSGIYTIWGEFKVGDRVIPTVFTVKVEN